MTQYKCDCCSRIAPASDWSYEFDDKCDELYVICPKCGSEAYERSEEDEENEEEYDEEEEEEEYA